IRNFHNKNKFSQNFKKYFKEGMKENTCLIVPIVYASQSGNSLHVSKLISDKIKQNISNIDMPIISIDEFSLMNFSKDSKNNLIIFVCSTYGQGDFPFHAQHFYNILVSDVLPKDFLKNFNFAIFGMGDSSYEKYNFASLKLYNALKSLGGHMIIERGMGNIQDKNGYYTALYPWIDQMVKYFT
ncbi:NADPH cytochrome P450 reductase, partial [Pseudoloma neurophilia]